MLTYGAAPYSESGKIGKKTSDIAVIGMPSDLGATTRSGQSSGPQHVRFYSEPLEGLSLVDAGNVVPDSRDNSSYLSDVGWHVGGIGNNTRLLIGLGGDDSVTHGFVMGLLDIYEMVGVVHYDAHPDMYGYGSGIDHSNWVQYSHDLGVPIRQWGCRADSAVESLNDNTRGLPLLLAIDMDVFDPAFAPGVACPHPFGLNPHEVMSDIFNITSNNKIVGISITEIVDNRDINGHTALLANHLLAKICKLVLARQ